MRPRILIAAQQIRPSQPRLPDRLDAVHPRHGIVDDQEINFGPAFQYANCCLGATTSQRCPSRVNVGLIVYQSCLSTTSC